MSKKNVNNNLCVVKLGTSVPDALEFLTSELKSLTDITESSYKTGGDGKVTNFGNTIQIETSVEKLIQMYSSIVGRSVSYNKAQEAIAKEIGGKFQAPVFRDNGASAEHILSDIILRIKVLSVSERKAKLEKYITEAKSFMTKEMQFDSWQRGLSSELGFESGEVVKD